VLDGVNPRRVIEMNSWFVFLASYFDNDLGALIFAGASERILFSLLGTFFAIIKMR